MDQPPAGYPDPETDPVRYARAASHAIDTLIGDDSWLGDARVLLAGSGFPLTVPQIAALAVDASFLVRKNLAGSTHPLTGDQVTAFLADPEPVVRATVAASTRPLTPDQVTALLTDSEPDVRISVVTSTRPLTPDQVAIAATDTDSWVRAALLTRVGLPDPVTADIPTGSWATLLIDPATPTETRAAVAALTDDPDTVHIAAHDPDPGVACVAIRNPHVTDQTLTGLADHPDPRIQAAVGDRILHAVLT